MAEKLDIMLELERRGALPPDKGAIIQELRRRGAVPPLAGAGGSSAGGSPAGATPEPRQTFDPEGAGAMGDAPVRPIADERYLEGTGLPPGSAAIDVGRQNPEFDKILGGDKRVVQRGGRYYTTGRSTTKQDDMMGGEFNAVDHKAELADQLPVENAQLDEAPGAARESAGFALDEVEGYKKALGPGAQVRRIQSTGPLKDRIVYRMADSEPWKTVAKPGMSISTGDLRSLFGEVLPTLGGTAGGVAGSFLPAAAVGTAAGTFVGSAGGEMARIAEGIRRGVIPKEVSGLEIATAVGKRAGVDALGAAGGAVLYRLYKAFGRRGLPDIGMTEEQFLQALGKKGANLDAEGKALLTTPDIVEGSAGARLRASEKLLQTDPNPAADPFRQRAADKEAYGRKLIEGELPDRNLPAGPTQVGEGVAAAAPNAEADLAGLGARIHPDIPAASAPIRTAIEKAQDQAETGTRAIYQRVDQAMAGRSIAPTNTNAKVDEYGKLLESDVFKKLSEEDATLVGNWAKEAYNPDGTLRPLDYGTIDRGLHSIRRAIRSAYKGEWSGDLQMLSELEEGLIKDRANLIKAHPNGAKVAADLSAAETQWKEIKSQFKRTKLSDFTKLMSGGRQAVGDEALGAKIFNDPESARVVGKILQDPQFAAEREAVRMQMRWHIESAAKGEGGDINADALKTMLRNNEPLLENFFSKGEIARFSNPIEAQKLRKAMGVAKMENPTEWFDKFWNKGNVRDAEATMARLRSVDPNMAKAVQGFTQQKLYSSLTSEGQHGAGRAVDPAKFEKLLGEDNGQRAEWLGRVMDPGFAARLRAVNEAVRTLNPTHSPVRAAAMQEPGVFGAARRAGRLVFGVLSKEARQYNLAVTMVSDKIRKRAAEAILDPKVYAAMLANGRETAGGKAAAVMLGQQLARETSE